MSIKTQRHKTNPFVDQMVIPVGSKQVRISSLGKDSNILVNQHTGEVSGTHVVAYKRVDTERFIKTYADYMAFTFDLTKSGNKALRVVMWAVKEQTPGKDKVILDKYAHAEFLDEFGYEEKSLSYPTFTRGLAELEKAQIIAKTLRTGHYFINPSCMFNGDRRVAFSTVLEQVDADEPEQPDLLEGK